ncbi:MAG: hypothetical protein IJA87_07945 [Clostridia bacterium]|nr:hypothetical protein [Clostridia bacterium]
MIRYIFRFIPLLISIIITFGSTFADGAAQLEIDIAEQTERIAQLEQAYNNGEIPPVDETSFFNGDLNSELEAGIKFNELAFIATHNSYQKQSVPSVHKLNSQLSELTFGLSAANKGEFENQTLTQQFNCGIRSVEIDIETFDRDGEISFTCMHSPTLDMSTTCYDFELALKEIVMWSDNNPDHLPITVIIEPKRVFLPLEDMKFFNMEYVLELDSLLREKLGDKLFTPSDMLRDYASFGEMRASDDWCAVKNMLGKVVVLLHDTGVTEKYIGLDPSIRSQAMFPMLRPADIDRDCASFLIINNPEKIEDCKVDVLNTANFIIRTRPDEFNKISKERLETAIYSGAQIISTDYPPKDDLTSDSYFVTFENGKTVASAK